MHNPLEKIALLFAMQEEAAPVVETLGLKPVPVSGDRDLPFTNFQGRVNGLFVAVTVSGKDHRYDVDNIGPMAATLMTYAAINDFSPDLVISAGTAGGFAERGADIGTVYLSDDRFVFHDRVVPLTGFDHSNVGHYPALNVRRMAVDLGLPVGVVSSGSSLEKNPRDIAVIERHQAVAKEMEAAAVAWVCMLKEVPFLALKSITNLLDRPGTSEAQFVQNLGIASDHLRVQMLRVLEYLPGKTFPELEG